jgi:hypothetical protein
MQKSIKTVYNAFSGTFLNIPEEDLKLISVGQLPLNRKPSSSCKKCFGKGHIGRDKTNLNYYICSCIRKNLDLDAIKHTITNNIDFEGLLKE